MQQQNTEFKYILNIDSSRRYSKIITLASKSDSLRFEGEFDLCQKIQEILKDQKIDINDVEFTFFRGPGESFTGLKMAAAVVNTLNYALKRIGPNSAVLPEYGREPNITISSKNKLL